MKEILQVCSFYKLKDCAYRCLLPNNAKTKVRIINTLLHGEDDYYILRALDKSSLKAICYEYDLPVTGNREELIDRIWPNIDPPEKNTQGKAIKRICIMCNHKYDFRITHDHHFVPKSKTKYEGGTVRLCANCHYIFHALERETEKKLGRRLLDYDEQYSLFFKTKKGVRAGKYGRYGRP